MTTLRFHPEARAELRAAVRYYHERDPQLAKDLVSELRSVVDRVVEFPGSGSPRKRLRHVVLDRFPFAVVYSTVEDIRFRNEAGLTQTELAERMDKKQSWISRVEAGRENVTMKTLGQFAHALEKDPAEFLAPVDLESPVKTSNR